MRFLREALEWLADRFAFSTRWFRPGLKRRLSQDLFQAKMTWTVDEWLSISFGLACCAAAVCALFVAITADFAPVSIIAFAAAFVLVKNYPKGRKKRIAAVLEAELPAALRGIAVELSVGAPFEACVASAARGDTKLAAEFSRVSRDVRNGASVPQALRALGARVDSSEIGRSVTHAITAYRKGGKQASELLKKLADELADSHRLKMKEYNGKLTVWCLLFIACSAVAPALAQAFIAIGPAFLDLQISREMAFAIPAVFFPIVNSVLFFTIRSRRPHA